MGKKTNIGSEVQFQKGYAFKSSWYRPEGHPVVRVSNFTDSSVDTSDLIFIPEEIAKDYGKYRLSEGDVVIQTVGSWPSNPASVVGKVIRIQKHASEALLNQNAVKLIPFASLDQRFLFYRLKNEDYRSYIINTAQGAASQASITLDSIRAFEFVLPAISYQQRIASILSAYDDLIENNTRRIKILEDMAQMLYREWFVNFRFPGHENVRMVESELGPIPEGWKVRKLSTLVKTQYGYTESATINPVGPKYLRGMDINKSSYIQWDTVPYCPIATTDHGSYRLRVGDIVVIRMADPGKVGMVEKDIDAVFASYLIRLQICDSSLSPYYLFSFLLSERYQDYVTGASTGTTRKSASAGVITDVPLLLPDSATCERYELFIRDSRRMLNNLLDRNSILRTTRDLLLPKLISGEISVEAFDEAAAELTEQTA